MTPVASTEELARAKINLSLKVLGRRGDGYHELQSLVVFVDVGDRVTAMPAAEFSMALEGPFASALTEDGDNLVLRAARLLGGEMGRAGAHVALCKNLPVASGIGGGSADAAATLRALARLCFLRALGACWLVPCMDLLVRVKLNLIGEAGGRGSAISHCQK